MFWYVRKTLKHVWHEPHYGISNLNLNIFASIFLSIVYQLCHWRRSIDLNYFSGQALLRIRCGQFAAGSWHSCFRSGRVELLFILQQQWPSLNRKRWLWNHQQRRGRLHLQFHSQKYYSAFREQRAKLNVKKLLNISC